MFYFIARAASNAADAGENQLVTCGGLDCSVCKLIEMVTNIFSWLLWVSFAVAILFTVVGGFIYIGSRGNDSWMSQAKRTIFWAIGGFAIMLLAYLAINTTAQVIGGKNENLWSKFECGTSSSTESKNISQKKVADIANSAKNGGQLIGKMAEGTTADEFLQMIAGLSPSDMALVESDIEQNNKIVAAIGKDKNKQPELLYVNSSLINSLFQAQQDKSSWLLNKANADESGNPSMPKLTELSQIIARILDKNIDLFFVITDRPGNESGSTSATSLIKVIDKINQCVSSGGYWYRFSDICKAEQENCSAAKCAPTGNSNPVTNCKCPEDQCSSEGQCTAKNK